jgi:hypothetical protein
MRDEIDARIWAAHHDQFSVSLDAGFAAIAAGLRSLSRPRELSKQLLSAAGAFAMTLLTLSGSVA